MRGGGAASGRVSILGAASKRPGAPARASRLLLRRTRDLCRSWSGQSHRWGSALQRLRPQTGERFGPWALKRGRRRSAPAGRGIPQGSPRGPHGCPRRREPARLSHVPCVKPQRAHKRAAKAPSRRARLRRGRCRAAKLTTRRRSCPPSVSTLPGCHSTHKPSQRPLQSRTTPYKQPCPSKYKPTI